MDRGGFGHKCKTERESKKSKFVRGGSKLPPLDTSSSKPNFKTRSTRFKKDEMIIKEQIYRSAVEAYEKVTKWSEEKPSKIKRIKYPPEMYSRGRLLRMNYEAMKKIIEESPITPMQPALYQRILCLVPNKLKNNPNVKELSNQLKEEIDFDFIETIKKLNVRMTLREPEDEYGEEENKEEVNELESKLNEQKNKVQTSPKWHENYILSSRMLSRNLHITHYCFRQVLALSENIIGKMLLLDCKSYRSLGCKTFEQFKSILTRGCREQEDKVQAEWVQAIVQLMSEKKDAHLIKNKKVESFFNCLASLMSREIRDLLTRSIQAWVDTFDERNKAFLPLLKMELILDEETKTMMFYPYFSDLKDLIIYAVDCVAESLQEVPKIVSWNQTSGFTYLNCQVPPSIIKSACFYLVESINRNFEEPWARLEKFNRDYSYLVNGNAASEIEDFINSEHTFEEYQELYVKFLNIMNEIKMLNIQEHYDMVELDCTDLKLGLTQSVVTHIKTILNKMADDLRELNNDICFQYQSIADVGLKIPETLKELIDMQTYIENVRNTDIFQLNMLAKESFRRIMFMLDCYIFSEEDLALNSTVPLWPIKINPVFDANDEIIDLARQRFFTLLSERKEKLLRDLAKLRVRIDTFNDYSDTTQLDDYFKVVKSTMMRIADHYKERDKINEEEDMFGISCTDFPEIAELDALAQPFYKLFNALRKWMKAEKRWMDGNFSELVTDQIDDESKVYLNLFTYLMRMFRTNYEKILAEAEFKRMEKMKKIKRRKKGSADVEPSVLEEELEELAKMAEPAILPMIDEVSRQIEEFRENIPIMRILCNPGLRSRHWKQLSDIVGFDIEPDSGTTLRKMLKLRLEEYTEKFSTISIGASKEHMLEKSLHKMKEEWENLMFEMTHYRDTTFPILASCDEIQALLDDHIMKTLTMKGSVHVKPFEAELIEWEKKIHSVQDIIDGCLSVQAQWMYLEPIFSSEDIMQQMPDEGRKFHIVDKNWREIMNYVASDKFLWLLTCLAC